MSIELFNLRGKNALITGGTHGIGMAVAMALGKAGARICVNDISDEKLEACRAAYAQQGIEAYTLNFNVTSEADVDRGIARIERDVAPVDILVNNAGIIKRVPMLDMPIDDFKQVLDIDLVAPLIDQRDQRCDALRTAIGLRALRQPYAQRRQIMVLTQRVTERVGCLAM